MMISGLLLTILMVLAVWIIAFYGFSSHNLLILLGLVIAPVCIFLLNNPSIWFIAILGIQQSGLIIPGVPQGLELIHLLMSGFIVLAVVRGIMGGGTRQKTTMTIRSVYFYLAVLILTIAFRGIGLRFLGSSKWGGMGYVRLFIAAGFLLTARYVTLTIKQWKAAICFMLFFSFLPSIAQLVFMASGGRIYQQYMFIHAYIPGLLGALDALETGDMAVRFHLLKNVASNLIIAGIVFIPFRGTKRLLLITIVAFCFILAGLSGFRSAVLALGGSLFLYSMFIDKKLRVRRSLLFLVCGVVAIVIIVPLASFLPGPIQRAVSWIPGANVDAQIKMNAVSTIDWRLEIWKLAWREVPDYLLVGKGFAINPGDMQLYSTRTNSILAAFLAHTYHSGPLGLLLDLGLMGFFAGTAFFVFSANEVIRNAKYLYMDTFIRRFYYITMSIYIYRIASFYLVFGDARESFIAAFITFAILNGIANTAKQELLKPEKDTCSKITHRQPRINPFDHPDF
jgi:hypothetical protein